MMSSSRKMREPTNYTDNAIDGVHVGTLGGGDVVRTKMTASFKPSSIRALLLALFVCLTCNADAQKVYITKTGAKYHRKDCRYLKYSSFEIDLSEAKERGHTPCSVCRPQSDEKQPKPSGGTTDSKPDQVTPLFENSTPSKTTSQQCTARTQAGSRCKRMTTNANGRCWQHQ
jgi:hypothetical protein